jgi:xanthine dehydrogenase YagR molybdenum-binding subunit
VRVEIGDSSLPIAPTAGGSQTVASVAPALQRACEGARAEVARLAIADGRSPLSGARVEDVAWGGGRLFLRRDPGRGETYAEILARSGRPGVEVCFNTPTAGSQEAEPRNPAVAASASGARRPPCAPYSPEPELDANQAKYSFHSFGAQFAEVRVDPDLGIVRVSRIVSVHDVGRVLNAKTAESQVRGGVTYGIGMALMEESHYDPRNGLPVTRTLGDYHIPSHADVPRIDVRFVGVPDPHINVIGARGIGEIGITGVAAAIANAVYHATGKRVRDLPITPDKLL